VSRARAHRAGTVAGPGLPERIKWHTAARLLGLLLPLKWRMAGVIAATCAFVTLNVAAPKVLGDATDVVVDGFLGGSLDEQQLAERLLAVAAMYVGASLFSWIQGSLTATAVQRLSYGLRGSVEQKLHVLPSSISRNSAAATCSAGPRTTSTISPSRSTSSSTSSSWPS